MMKNILLLMIGVQACCMAMAQQVIPLYSGKIPYAKPVANREVSMPGADGKPRISKVSEPTLSVFLPPAAKANGTAVIICPGGGYVHLSIIGEGEEVARLLNEWGVAAFVLKYRLPDDSTMERREIGPLQDAQRAIQLVRERAKEWRVNPRKTGIMGFSAGGYLASALGTHYKTAWIPNPRKTSLRPDFMVLVYPVVSLEDSLSKFGRVVLGAHATPASVELYSNEQQVTKDTPPAFLVQARDDKSVDPRNSQYFYDALRKRGIRSELHFYEKGGHGFGLHNPMSPENWTDWLRTWMQPYLGSR